MSGSSYHDSVGEGVHALGLPDARGPIDDVAAGTVRRPGQGAHRRSSGADCPTLLKEFDSDVPSHPRNKVPGHSAMSNSVINVASGVANPLSSGS